MAVENAVVEGGFSGRGSLAGEQKKHTFTVYGEPFEVDVKYVPEEVLGKGAQGLVCSCVDLETGVHVAVKKIGDPFRNRLRSIMALREVQILRQLSHPNVISIRDVMLSSDSKQVYLVQELMDMDLGHVFESSARISGPLCRLLLLQTLLGVGFLHSAHVIHRDIKPDNLLLKKANSHLKICDFGHARTLRGSAMTDRVGTTRYKAPELLCGASRYTSAVDMWSVGCVFADMLGGGEPIFPGTDTLSQMGDIYRVLGTPSDLSFVECERAKSYLEGLPYSPGQSLRSLYPEADSSAVDLLGRMLEFDPRKRISAKEALQHRFFEGVYDPSTMEIVAPSVVKLQVDEDPTAVDEEKVRDLIWDEILLYHPHQPTLFH